MKTALYVRNPNDWNSVLTNENFDEVFIGDIGCPHVTSIENIIEFNKKLEKQGISLHYISPRIPERIFSIEFDKIKTLIQENIPVSINDWGLIFKINKIHSNNKNLYLGRYLTSGVTNWAFHKYFLETETSEVKNYFLQEKFGHSLKLELLKEYGIKGLEFSIYNNNENEYIKIKERGFEVIGYLNSSVLSISRSCPILKINNITSINVNNCKTNCTKKYGISPVSCGKKDIYPNTYLQGNVLYEVRNNKVTWNGFEKIVL